MVGGREKALKGSREKSVGVLFSAGEEEREKGRGTTHFPQPGKKEGAPANDGKWDYGEGKWKTTIE